MQFFAQYFYTIVNARSLQNFLLNIFAQFSMQHFYKIFSLMILKILTQYLKINFAQYLCIKSKCAQF